MIEKGMNVVVTGRAALEGRTGIILAVIDGNFGRRWCDVELDQGGDIERLRESDVVPQFAKGGRIMGVGEGAESETIRTHPTRADVDAVVFNLGSRNPLRATTEAGKRYWERLAKEQLG